MGRNISFHYDKNPHQKEFHDDIKSKYLHLSGGYGCMRATTLIETESGKVMIKDLRKGMRVWSLSDDGPVLTECGEPYAKGIARLYRVIHEKGEYVAHGLHLISDATGNYQYVRDLSVGQTLLYIQPQTMKGSYPSKYVSNVQRLIQKAVSYQVGYQELVHLCDRLLHPERTSQNNRQHLQFQKKSDCLQLNLEFLKSNPLGTSESAIFSIEQLAEKEEFWDIEIPMTHNYIAEGCIHHNSGKTHALCMKAIQLSIINRDIPGGLVAPDFADLEKDILPAMEGILNDHKVRFDYRAGRYFRFPWTKAKLYLASGKKRIRGPNWGYALINEVTLIPYVRYREVIARVRLKRSICPQIASSGTPEGFGTDYHEHLIEKPFSDKVRVIYGSTHDNAQHLSEDYISSLESSFDKTMLDAYLKGLFVNMVGNRFYYAYDQKNEDSKIQLFDGHEMVYAAMDFNVEHMTTTIWRFDGSRLRGFDEIVLQNNAQTSKMCQEMKRRGYMPDNTIIFPDTAGKSRRTSGVSDIEVLKQEGYRDIRYKAAAPQFRTRQLNGNNLLEKGIIKINPDKMPTMKRDFLAVVQDPTTNEKLKDNAKLTHASDGFDYMIDLLFPFSGKRSGVTTSRYR